MKKTLSLLSLLLAVLMILASCGADKPLKLNSKVFNESRVKTAFSSTELTSVGEGYTLVSARDSLAVFKKLSDDSTSEHYKAINLKTNTVIREMTVTLSAESQDRNSLSLSSKGEFIVVYENKTYTLFKADGVTAIGSSKTAPYFVNDLAVIGSTVCRYDLKTFSVTDTFTYSEANVETPQCLEFDKFSGYYVRDIKEGLEVYDRNFMPVGSYLFPEYSEDANFFLLKNGNVLVQYVVSLPFDAKEYDLFMDGTKCDLIQKIISVKDLSEKEISLDFYVFNLAPVTDIEHYPFKKSIDNIAGGCEIEDFRFDESSETTVSLSNKGKIGKVYADGFRYYTPIANGYLYGTTDTGLSVVLDKKLNVVGHVSDEARLSEKYIVSENAIFDFTLTKLTDLTVDTTSYTFFTFIGNNPLLTSKDENGLTDYYIYDGAFNKIVDASEGQTIAAYNAHCYAVKTVTADTTTTVYYNSQRASFATFDSAVSPLQYVITGNSIGDLITANNKVYFISEAK